MHGPLEPLVGILIAADLHEWRNDFPTVSTIDSAKLKYE